MRCADRGPIPGKRFSASTSESIEAPSFTAPHPCPSPFRTSAEREISREQGGQSGPLVLPQPMFERGKGKLALKRKFEARWQRQPAGKRPHLLLSRLVGTPGRVVEGCGHKVLQHVAVLAQQARIDRHAAHLKLAGQDDLYEPCARLP